MRLDWVGPVRWNSGFERLFTRVGFGDPVEV